MNAASPFADFFASRGRPFRFGPAAALFAALALDMLFVLIANTLRFSAVAGAFGAIYWFAALVRIVAWSVSAVLAFRYIRNDAGAAAAAAGMGSFVSLIVRVLLIATTPSSRFRPETFVPGVVTTYISYFVLFLALAYGARLIKPVPVGMIIGWVGTAVFEFVLHVIVFDFALGKFKPHFGKEQIINLVVALVAAVLGAGVAAGGYALLGAPTGAGLPPRHALYQQLFALRPEELLAAINAPPPFGPLSEATPKEIDWAWRATSAISEGDALAAEGRLEEAAVRYRNALELAPFADAVRAKLARIQAA